ncbi:MAG: endonuclease domain-containing protein [Rugosibacter sp.]|nr:endonuclease domain-containing protein [Rugosibacter sp.]
MEQREFAKHLRHRMTESETKLWRHLRAHRLNGEKFRRQQPMGPYIVDFVHFGARLIVEADGGQHNDALRDESRDAWLRAQGFKVLRFWNNEIMSNLEGVLETVMAAVTLPPLPQPRSAYLELRFAAGISREGRGGNIFICPTCSNVPRMTSTKP